MSSREITFAAAGAGAPPNYIEDVFSTYLYTGNGSTQTITNNIDLSTKGGLVWLGKRTTDNINLLADTVRGNTKYLTSYTTDAEATATTRITSFNSNGFSLGNSGLTNTSADYVSWTFREQAKFFDVVTYTGNGVTSRSIPHNLQSSPGCYIIKRTDSTGNWLVAHIGAGGVQLDLNLTAASNGSTGQVFADSTSFSPGYNRDLATGGSSFNYWNTNGATYVAYLFAHNAGGFGLTGTDNVISCGSYTGGAVPNAVTLGFEPQYILIKNITTAGNDWVVTDVMRGMSQTTYAFLNPNTSAAEDAGTLGIVRPTATGFSFGISTSSAVNESGNTYIYMAIRRPMKTPTSGTEVFSPVASSASQGTILTTGFAIDSQWAGVRAGDSDNITVIDRLRGTSTNTTESNGNFLETSNAGAENTGASASRARYWNNTGFQMPGSYSGGSMVFWNFSRRPGFFDVVCYTGTGSGVPERNHNLGVAPELMIIKSRNTADLAWVIYAAPLGNTKYLGFVGNGERTSSTMWDSTTPTSTQFFVGNNTTSNTSGATYVAYLFATCAGVSKVGSYTGTGSTQTINCGFTGGARYVMIQRTDTDGYAFYVWDTARGMVAGTDPKLALNSTAAETNANWVYTVSTGFQIVTTDASVNASGGTYIYLAIA